MICLHLSECETVKNCLCIEILLIINKYKVNEHIEGLISQELNHGSLMESLLFVQWAWKHKLYFIHLHHGGLKVYSTTKRIVSSQ